MIKIENVNVVRWKEAIRGMRNPMNSWDRSDTVYIPERFCDYQYDYELSKVCGGEAPLIDENDYDLMLRLAKSGKPHSKYCRMIVVYVDIVAPLYWWKEFDTYKVCTVANSCSTMHKIAAKEFELDDFSHEHLLDFTEDDEKTPSLELGCGDCKFSPDGILGLTINMLNICRKRYLETNDKDILWQMIQLLPSSYNQRRTVMLNYEVLNAIYYYRKYHKQDEWREFCAWIETLPHSDLITCNSSVPFVRGNDYKREAIKAARDLGYGEDIIEEIKQSTSDDHICQIMQMARKRKR